VPRARPSRWARRAKSDRINVRLLLRAVIAYESGDGDREACRPVQVPTIADEDAERLHRERAMLISERVRRVNRTPGVARHQGGEWVRAAAPRRPGSKLSSLRCSDGSDAPLPLLSASRP